MISENSAFHTAIFDALCASLNLTEEEGVQLIHEAYAEPENVPRPPRNRNVIYLDGRFFPRQILRNAGIYPVPDPPQPQLLHEEEGSLWRRRADLTISLRVRDEQVAQARGSVTTAPAVVIHRPA